MTVSCSCRWPTTVRGSTARRKAPVSAGMRERALLVKGTLTIESRPGAGTTVSLELPPDATSG